MGELVTQTELARRLGLSEGAVRKHIKRGLYRANGDGRFDVEKCRSLLEAGRDPDAALKGIMGGDAVRVNKPDPGSVAAPSMTDLKLPENSLTRARAANAVMQAKRSQLALEKDQGKVINTSAAIMAARAVVTVVVERMDAAASQIAQRVVGLDVVAAERVAREVLNEVRAEIARLDVEVGEVAGGGN